MIFYNLSQFPFDKLQTNIKIFKFSGVVDSLPYLRRDSSLDSKIFYKRIMEREHTVDSVGYIVRTYPGRISIYYPFINRTTTEHISYFTLSFIKKMKCKQFGVAKSFNLEGIDEYDFMVKDLSPDILAQLII